MFSASARPFNSAFGELIYKDAYERASAIFHGIICDHAFVDGNKRTGTAAALLLLDAKGVLPDFNEQGHLRLGMLGQVALAAASGQLIIEQTIFWMRRLFEPPAK